MRVESSQEDSTPNGKGGGVESCQDDSNQNGMGGGVESSQDNLIPKEAEWPKGDETLGALAALPAGGGRMGAGGSRQKPTHRPINQGERAR